MPEQTFGEWLRDIRTKQNVSLRSVAQQIDISAPYLSDVETDRRIPSEEVIEKLSELLGVSAEEIAVRSGRIGKQAEKYIKRNPEMVRLIRHFASENISPEMLTTITRRYYGGFNKPENDAQMGAKEDK